LATVLVRCGAEPQTIVKTEHYDAYWLWAGVKPQPALNNAKRLYLHYGEVKAESEGRLQVMRPQIPETGKRQLWLVVRAETLKWPDATYAETLKALDRWRAAGNNLAGLQIDFDAKTRHLQNYAVFLANLRARLPKQYQLSITGLLDWSANGDPAGLHAIGNSVDELVLQVYQGRQTIPGYERYLGKLDRLGIPFRIGLVQGGVWKAPPSLSANPDFRGFVVFLVNEKRSD
jgi:Protein of unknown function (DUF3142)